MAENRDSAMPKTAANDAVSGSPLSVTESYRCTRAPRTHPHVVGQRVGASLEHGYLANVP